MQRSLVIGFGNPLRGDDGFGPIVAQHFLEQFPSPNVSVLIRHQLTLDLAEELKHFERVIFVDAAADGPPNQTSVTRIHLESTQSEKPPFSHHVAIQEVLWTAATLYDAKPTSYLLSARGENFDLELSLSQPMRALVPQAIEELRKVVSNI